MENWAWGLSLIPLTILIHATAIGFMALSGRLIRDRMQIEVAPWHAMTITIGLICAIGSLLAVLHGIEAVIWATAYWWLGALRSPQEGTLAACGYVLTKSRTSAGRRNRVALGPASPDAPPAMVNSAIPASVIA